jgi:hypothetical protein
MQLAGLLGAHLCKPYLTDLTEVTTGFSKYKACAFVKGLSMLGEIIGDVNNIIEQESWTIKDDYCDQADKSIGAALKGTETSSAAVAIFGNETTTNWREQTYSGEGPEVLQNTTG